jgi:hypothetical protein
MSARVNEVLFTPLHNELLGTIRAPAPPLQRIISQLATIRMPGSIEAAALACFATEKKESNATDPPLRQWLANVRFTEVPKVDAPQTSAVDALLSDEAFKKLVSRLDSQWTRKAAESRRYLPMTGSVAEWDASLALLQDRPNPSRLPSAPSLTSSGTIRRPVVVNHASQ